MAASPESDPTMCTLVPRRSVRRNLLLAGVAVAVFAGVWVAPHVLRPSVVPDNPAGMNAALAPHYQVLAVVRLGSGGWPPVDLQAVGDLPGAAVAGAWLAPADALATLDDQLEPGDFSTGLDYLQAAFRDRTVGVDSQLPQPLDVDETALLVVLWDITDCALLTEGQQPEIALRTILGTTTHEPLPDIASPAFDLDTLTQTGLCPPAPAERPDQV